MWNLILGTYVHTINTLCCFKLTETQHNQVYIVSISRQTVRAQQENAVDCILEPRRGVFYIMNINWLSTPRWNTGLRLSIPITTHITHAMMTAKPTNILTLNFQFNGHYWQNGTTYIVMQEFILQIYEIIGAFWRWNVYIQPCWLYSIW